MAFGSAVADFGEMHVEHAVLELRLHLIRIDFTRQTEPPQTLAVFAFDLVELLAFLLFLLTPLAFDGQRAVQQFFTHRTRSGSLRQAR
jgi:hypothetical protein